MTDAQTMNAAVAAVVREELAHLQPVSGTGPKHLHPEYNRLREALNRTEVSLRGLIRGDETEQHEWLAVIHYALAEERTRLLT